MSNNRTFSENVKSFSFALSPVYPSGLGGYTGRTSAPPVFSSSNGPEASLLGVSGPLLSRGSGSNGLEPGSSSLASQIPPRHPEKKGISSGLPVPGMADSSGRQASRGPFNLNLLANSPTAPRETIPKRREKSQKRDEKTEDSGWKAFRCVRCGSWALIRSCSDGHTFAKTLDCGREWCEKCRTSSHGRRMSRWLPKLQKIKEMGYLVVTFPLDRRPRRALDLQKIGRSITGVLKRRGFVRGVRRWHTQGDKSATWNPHLNFLMDGGFLSEERLDSIKKAICEILKTEKIVGYYQYTQSIGKMLHWLKYVTRPTFLKQEWDPEMAEELYNFRNSGWWGKWDDEDKWTLPEKEKNLAYYKKIEAGICPTCGKKLEGGRVAPVSDFLEDLDWAQIWDKEWQYKGPPENVLIYRLLKDFPEAKKGGGGYEY